MRLRSLLFGIAATASFLVACGSAGTAEESPATPSPIHTPTGLAQPANTPAGTAASTANWTRPLDVQPLPAQGRFQAIGENPMPGDKVRVFFMGAQF